MDINSRKMPGCSPWRYLYSPSGRLVAEHTPSMADGEWLLHLHDRYGREVLTATATLTDTDCDWYGNAFPRLQFTAGTGFGGYLFTGRGSRVTPIKATY